MKMVMLFFSKATINKNDHMQCTHEEEKALGKNELRVERSCLVAFAWWCFCRTHLARSRIAAFSLTVVFQHTQSTRQKDAFGAAPDSAFLSVTTRYRFRLRGEKKQNCCDGDLTKR